MVGAAGRPRDTQFKLPPTMPQPSQAWALHMLSSETVVVPLPPAQVQGRLLTAHRVWPTTQVPQLLAELTSKTTHKVPSTHTQREEQNRTCKYSGRSPPNQKNPIAWTCLR